MGEKIVFDTNVWVSILLNKRLSEELAPLIERNEFQVYLSYELLREIATVLTYPKVARILRMAGVSRESALASVVKQANLVRSKRSVRVVEKDPSDNRVLECALASGAKTIVSGDRHLLALKQFEGIMILSPREFNQSRRRIRANA